MSRRSDKMAGRKSVPHQPSLQQKQQDDSLFNRNSFQSLDFSTRLTANPHAFAGAVLNPKHARELTPKTVLRITHTLGLHALENARHDVQNDDEEESQPQDPKELSVQYTVWITEAWRCLMWAEPSAALFWEMATMYYTLHTAARSIEIEEAEEDQEDHGWGIQRTLSQTIPPILSCESSQSLDSTEEKKKRGDSPQNSPQKKSQNKNANNNKASAASAKELPVWLIGMFLLLHCEEESFWRNVSGEDEQRFDALMAKQNATSGIGEIFGTDLSKFLNKINSRSQHYHHDHLHCSAYLLRHLRKFMLLACVPSSAEALDALYDLALDECVHDAEYEVRRHGASRNNPYSTMDPDELVRRHDEEHREFGTKVKMTNEELERLNLVFQAPHGGSIDDPPLFIADILQSQGVPTSGGVYVGDAESEIRRHLERELNGNNSLEDGDNVEDALTGIKKLSIGEKGESKSYVDGEEEDYNKELSYIQVRGSTILLKPNNHTDGTHKKNTNPLSGSATNSRLHDVYVTGCSDSHMYLLQPFEHATIAACSNCTIVVGAGAGLLHVVDCERTTITAAARRVLVSNCYDVTLNIFTPSPSLLVGDNRNVKFAPYNTYYDGLREDLLATGLAAGVVSQDTNEMVSDPLYGPTLQCASNKWKQPVELSTLSDLLQAQSLVPPRSSSPTPGSESSTDDAMKTPSLVPASEFQVLLVPYISEAAKERRARQEMAAEEMTVQTSGSFEDSASIASGASKVGNGIGSMYCHNVADVLQLSPFRLPTEYEKRAVKKTDQIKILQAAMQNLTEEQQAKLEEELNSGFRDWLVTSGNLRQVLDLVHLDRKENTQSS